MRSAYLILVGNPHKKGWELRDGEVSIELAIQLKEDRYEGMDM